MENQNKGTAIEKLLQNNKMFAAFKKFAGMEQEGKNDYEVGCIQTANALMPIIIDLILELQEKTKEQI